MPARGNGGRPNQRLRTRHDLLSAAARLLKQGRTPSLEQVAEAAMVSRATAYRYFPSIDALLVEAPIEGEAPDAEALFKESRSADPEVRVDAAEAALHEMVYRNEIILLGASISLISVMLAGLASALPGGRSAFA